MSANFDLRSAFMAKMSESKISASVARKLGFQPLAAEKVPKGVPFKEPGILIPYYDFAGHKTDFWRLRYLRQPKPTGFSALTKRKPLRYVQPKDSVNELYLPPIIDWEEVAEEPVTEIIITEGEFKAACACENTGYACIGLGGVWSWMASKKGIEILEGFHTFKWEDRIVYICFDSDAVLNPMVMQAEVALAKALTNLKAQPYIVRIPMGDNDEEMGLDDFIVKKGPEALDELLENSRPWVAARELHKLNGEAVYIRNQDAVLLLDDFTFLTRSAFTDGAFAGRIYYEEVATDKTIRRVKKNAAREWLEWNGRAEVKKITYAPGEERITDDREFNIWPGWGCEPAPGDITPWVELLDLLFGENIESRTWFERWCAWPLQHPGSKMFSSSVLWGLRKGTGKSLVGYTLGKIYGLNFAEINDRILGESHNEWARNTQFAMGDEISTGDKRAASDRMKTMITREQLRINPKFIQSYVVPDVINYYFTSNHPDSFFLEDDDRRFFIHEVKAAPLPKAFYDNYGLWLGGRGGVGPGIPALFHHLLTLDMGDFSATSRALETEAKQEMLKQGRSDLANWVVALREDPDTILRSAGRILPYSLWPVNELLRIYDPNDRGRVKATGLAKELARQGVERACEGGQIRTPDGQLRLWILRNQEKLLEMNSMQIGNVYENERKPKNGKEKYR